MERHPQTAHLREKLRRCLPFASPWKGTFYRATTIDYANRRDLLSGTGSRMAGGRWNSAGSFNAVYGSLEPETAMAEPLARLREFGIPVSEAMPLVFVAVTVELQSVLDLMSIEVQQTIGLTLDEMVSVDWKTEQRQGRESLTQSVGRAAWEERVEGILVPSARRLDAKNIVLFPSRRLRGSSWKIHRARKLMQNPAR